MLTMTNDEAQEWLLAQHNAAPGPPDPARFGAAIRAIRAAAVADGKELALEIAAQAVEELPWQTTWPEGQVSRRAVLFILRPSTEGVTPEGDE